MNLAKSYCSSTCAPQSVLVLRANEVKCYTKTAQFYFSNVAVDLKLCFKLVQFIWLYNTLHEAIMWYNFVGRHVSCPSESRMFGPLSIIATNSLLYTDTDHVSGNKRN